MLPGGLPRRSPRPLPPPWTALSGPQRFRVILAKIDDAKRKMGRVMQLAAFSLAEVTYAAGGDISYMIQENVGEATFRVRAKQDNVSGTILPAFEAVRGAGAGAGGESSGGTSTPASSGAQASRPSSILLPSCSELN